jgi:hypothetical protein
MQSISHEWSRMSYSRHTGPRDRSLRAGDAERDAVAEILRHEHLAGRLDDAELETRLSACFAAVSYAELDRLLADLPDATPERHDQRRTIRSAPWPLILVPLALVAVIASHGRALWLLVPLVFFLVVRPLGARRWTCGPWTGRGSTAR